MNIMTLGVAPTPDFDTSVYNRSIVRAKHGQSSWSSKLQVRAAPAAPRLSHLCRVRSCAGGLAKYRDLRGMAEWSPDRQDDDTDDETLVVCLRQIPNVPEVRQLPGVSIPAANPLSGHLDGLDADKL